MLSCLIVEDNPVNYMVMQNQLNKLGFKTIVAINGKEALNYCFSNPLPDLLLVDGYMPEMDGITFIKAFRELRGNDTSLIVFCSSSVDKVDIEEALRIGANLHYAKPITQEQYHTLIDLIHKQRQPLKSTSQHG